MASKFGLDKFVLKIIGCLLMTLGTIAATVVPYSSTAYVVLMNISILVLPIFVFMTVDSVFKTKRPLFYLLLLFVFALFYVLADYVIMYTDIYPKSTGLYVGNIFVDLFLGAMIAYFAKIKNRYSFLIVIPLALYILSFFKFKFDDFYVYPFLTKYGILSFCLFVIIILCYSICPLIIKKYSQKNNQDNEVVESIYLQRVINISSAVMSVTLLLINLLIRHYNIIFINVNPEEGIFLDYCAFGFIFLLFYNGKQGLYNKIVKYSFYSYYPLHILILYGFSFLS